MVSRGSLNSLRKAVPAQIPVPYSPLEKTPHKAAVVGDGGTMSAASALIDMATEGSSATTRDGPQDLEVSPTEPRTVALNKVCSCAANDVGHL